MKIGVLLTCPFTRKGVGKWTSGQTKRKPSVYAASRACPPWTNKEFLICLLAHHGQVPKPLYLLALSRACPLAHLPYLWFLTCPLSVGYLLSYFEVSGESQYLFYWILMCILKLPKNRYFFIGIILKCFQILRFQVLFYINFLYAVKHYLNYSVSIPIKHFPLFV